MFISCVSLPPTSSLGTISTSSLTRRREKDEGHTGRPREDPLSLEVDVMICRRRLHQCEYDVEEWRQSCSSRIGRRGTSHRGASGPRSLKSGPGKFPTLWRSRSDETLLYFPSNLSNDNNSTLNQVVDISISISCLWFSQCLMEWVE